ncbi:hypothetical protein [Rhodosalinus sp. FB01]|uniref:hypothetical protein n=1 Tax=Rhodosalinus sp. FB01 TaxID=3239194 RepID=UPI003525D575
MFSATYVTVGFIFMMASGLIFEVDKNWFPESLKRAIVLIAVLCGIYVFAAGVHLLGGWEERVAGMSEATSGSGGRRGGFVVLFIRFLPFALMGFSAYALLYLRYPVIRMMKGGKV